MGLWSETIFGETPEGSATTSSETIMSEALNELKDAFKAKEELQEMRKQLTEYRLFRKLMETFQYLSVCSEGDAYCIGCREEPAPAPLLFVVTVEQSGDNPKYLYWEASMAAEADDVPIDVEDLINLINKLQEWRKT